MIRFRFRSFVRSATAIALAASLTIAGGPEARAQAPGSASGANRTAESGGGGGPRKQLATIIYAGLGGAVLGLSTLSFYGRPQEKLSNIAIGFALGVIAGTSFVTYKAMTNPSEFYGLTPQLEREGALQAESRAPGAPAFPVASWAWEF